VTLAALSIGALADDTLRGRLTEACAASGSRLHLLAGAVAGIEGLAAAALAGLESVVYESIKPPGAWRGTPAERHVDLDSLRSPVAFFEGAAREAAIAYPKNANVAATVAFAGVGLDATRVRLTADPDASGNRHKVVARGALGEWRLDLASAATGANARTSALVPLSIVRLLRNAEGSITL
jgi:aspartate dehydrogenase